MAESTGIHTFKPLNLGDLYISIFSEELLTERYVSWLNDSEVMRYSEQRHKKHTLHSCSDYLASMRSADRLFLSIEVDVGKPCHIGNISVSMDIPNNSADLSIMIGDKEMWGKGFASIAWIAVMEYLLYEAGLRRVTAGTMDVNDSMIRLIKRSGMNIDSVRLRHFIWEGQEVAFVTASRFS